MRAVLFYFILFSCSMLWPGFLAAQDDDFRCYTDELHQHLMQTDTDYVNRFMETQEEVRQQILRRQSQRDAEMDNAIHVIPLVVHVIHLGEPVGTGTNISDAQILNAVRGANERFRKIIGDGVDTQIEFCLATRDPNGCPTTGINRVSGAHLANYASSGIHTNSSGCAGPTDGTVKALSRWPVSRYYNVWVVANICPSNIAGYAYYPNGNVNDGTVIRYNYMTHSSITLAHELGHGFYLAHTFNGDNNGASCPSNTSCTANGDWLCDTPPHKRSDCSTTNPCTTAGTFDNSRRNFMSYCSSPGRTRFTNDGKNRMLATLNVNPRRPLTTSTGCLPVISTGAGTWTWRGTRSTNWFDPCNWDKGSLPGNQSDVVIPGGTTFQPTITGAQASCKSITIHRTNGAILTVNQGAGGELVVED